MDAGCYTGDAEDDAVVVEGGVEGEDGEGEVVVILA